MSIIIGSQDEPDKHPAFVCCDTHFCVYFKGFLNFFANDDNFQNYSVVEASFNKVPRLLFNEAYCFKDLMLIAFTDEKIAFFSIDNKKIIASFEGNGTTCVCWDSVYYNKLFSFGSNRLLKFWQINFFENDASLNCLYSQKLQWDFEKIIILKDKPNHLFSLTSSSSICVFERKNQSHPMKFLVEYEINTNGEQIIDISPARDNFLLIITTYAIFMFHFETGSFTEVVSIHKGASCLLQGIYCSYYPDWLFSFHQNGQIKSWRYSPIMHHYECDQNILSFPKSDNKYVKLLCQQQDKIVAFATDYSVYFIRFDRNKLFITNHYFVPYYNRCINPSANSDIVGFCTSCQMISIYSTQKNYVLSRIKSSKEVSNIHVISDCSFLYSTRFEVFYCLFSSSWNQTRIFCESGVEVIDTKVTENYIAVRTSSNHIYIFKKQILDEVFVFQSISYFDIISDGFESYLLVVSQEPNNIMYLNNLHIIIFEIEFNEKCLMSSFISNNTLYIYSSDGFIKEFSREGPNISYSMLFSDFCSFKFHAKSLLDISDQSADSSIKELQICDSLFFNEENTILYFDRKQLIYMDNHKFLRQTIFNNQKTLTYNQVFWSRGQNINHKFILNSLLFEASILSSNELCSEYVSNIYYFTNYKQLLSGLKSSNIYRSACIALSSSSISEEQKDLFKKSASLMEESQDFINSAIFHSLACQFDIVAYSLIHLKQFWLSYIYSLNNDLLEIAHLALVKYSLNIITEGRIIHGVSILVKLKETHIALHLLYSNKMVMHFIDLFKTLSKEGTIEQSTIHPVFLDFELAPIEELTSFFNHLKPIVF